MLKIDINELKKRPIPAFGPVNKLKQGFRQEVDIDRSNALFDEQMVDVRSLGIAGDNHYFTVSNPPYFQKVPGAIEELYLRESVANKLVQANAGLSEYGLELYLFDGWRPQSIQKHFHGVWFPDWLREHRPDIPEQNLMEEVEKYWSPPSEGENSPSPHSTGGATDLTLRFKDTLQPLYMGGIFDDLTENAHADWFERSEPQSMSDTEARSNRRLLYWVMDEAGFCHNPTEWWHFSYGDQMWARLKQKPAALFGGVSP
ncbi:M15 family metallopeptidase [Hirschia maritima]|uniref:M15 family metallopeptidase n=1 Tax=Hirschia maritima TaxID=1121961 RepID=UPI0003633C96|nr:M15 family metallopeptidase [Hirschia maritima]